jgi:phosphinothricin acetyltransferase
MIRNVRIEDAKEIVDIYNYYISNTNVTFEIDNLESEEMERRIVENTKFNPWIVYEEDNKHKEVGFKGEKWLDVIYLQVLME